MTDDGPTLTLIPDGSPPGVGVNAAASDQQYWSFTRLSTYSQCPTKYKLRYVSGAPAMPQGAMLGGKAVHRAIEHAENNRWWDFDPNADKDTLAQQNEWCRRAFLEAFLDEIEREAAGHADRVRWGGRVSDKWPHGEDIDWWMKQGPGMVRQFCQVRRDDQRLGIVPHESGSVETEVRTILPNGEGVRGFIDALLYVTADGEGIIRDYKTGTFTDPLQLPTYAWLVERSRGIAVTQGQFVMLRTGQIKPMPLDGPWAEMIEERLRVVPEKIKLGMFEPNPSNLCGSCQFRASCPAGDTGWMRQTR